jgi:hypothetical protein
LPKFPDELFSTPPSYREDLTHDLRKVWRYAKRRTYNTMNKRKTNNGQAASNSLKPR